MDKSDRHKSLDNYYTGAYDSREGVLGSRKILVMLWFVSGRVSPGFYFIIELTL